MMSLRTVAFEDDSRPGEEVFDALPVGLAGSQPQFQVLGSVVVSDAIHMMDVLVWFEKPSENGLYDQAVLGDASVASCREMFRSVDHGVAVDRPTAVLAFRANMPGDARQGVAAKDALMRPRRGSDRRLLAAPTSAVPRWNLFGARKTSARACRTSGVTRLSEEVMTSDEAALVGLRREHFTTTAACTDNHPVPLVQTGG